MQIKLVNFSWLMSLHVRKAIPSRSDNTEKVHISIENDLQVYCQIKAITFQPVESQKNFTPSNFYTVKILVLL